MKKDNLNIKDAKKNVIPQKTGISILSFSDISKVFIIFILILMSSMVCYSKSTFSGSRLREACIEYIKGMTDDNAKISVSIDIPDQNFDSDDITANCTARPNTLKGNTYLTIEFSEDSRIIRKLNVPVKVEIFAEIPVAKKFIKQKSEFKEEDIEFEPVDISNYSDDELVDIYSVIGFNAKKNINAGSTIVKSMIDFGGGIKKGDKITILVRLGLVSVKSEGIAVNDAEIGETVRVKREKAGSILTGIAGIDKMVYIDSY